MKSLCVVLSAVFVGACAGPRGHVSESLPDLSLADLLFAQFVRENPHFRVERVAMRRTGNPRAGASCDPWEGDADPQVWLELVGADATAASLWINKSERDVEIGRGFVWWHTEDGEAWYAGPLARYWFRPRFADPLYLRVLETWPQFRAGNVRAVERGELRGWERQARSRNGELRKLVVIGRDARYRLEVLADDVDLLWTEFVDGEENVGTGGTRYHEYGHGHWYKAPESAYWFAGESPRWGVK